MSKQERLVYSNRMVSISTHKAIVKNGIFNEEKKNSPCNSFAKAQENWSKWRPVDTQTYLDGLGPPCWIPEYLVCLCLIPLYDEKFKLVRSGKEIATFCIGSGRKTEKNILGSVSEWMQCQQQTTAKKEWDREKKEQNKKRRWLTGECFLHADNLNWEDLVVVTVVETEPSKHYYVRAKLVTETDRLKNGLAGIRNEWKRKRNNNKMGWKLLPNKQMAGECAISHFSASFFSIHRRKMRRAQIFSRFAT